METAVKKETLHRVIFSLLVFYFAYRVFQLDEIESVLASYFILSLFFGWRGETSFFTGIFLFLISWLLNLARPDPMIAPLFRYRWWFLIGGSVLLIVRHFSFLFETERKSGSYDRSFFATIQLLLHLLQETVLHGYRVSTRWYEQTIASIASIPRQTKISSSLIVVSVLLLLFFTNFSVFELLLWIFFLSGILFLWDPRFAISGALFSFALLALFLLFKNEGLANIAAVSAYEFLWIGLVHSIALYWGRKSDSPLIQNE